MRSVEVPWSLLKRGPEIIERTEKSRPGNTIRLKRPLSTDEFDGSNPVSLKKVRFAAKDQEVAEKAKKGTNEGIEHEDINIPVPLRKTRNGRISSTKRLPAPRVIRYSVKERNRGRKIIEIEQTEQTVPESGVDELAKQHGVVTSDWDPTQQETSRQVIAIGDQWGIDRFLNASPEPEAVEEHFKELHNLIKNFIFNWYDFEEPVHLNGRPHTDERPLESLEREASKELKHYITCHASGGPTGVDGWERLFQDKESREAVMYGVIAKALEEHVFGELLFGAGKEHKKHLEEQEADYAEKDGFERTELRANYIKKALKSRNWKGTLCYPPRYWSQIESLTLRLFALIYPLLLLSPKTVGLQYLANQGKDEGLHTEEQDNDVREAKRKELLRDLRMVVKSAAMTALLIRLHGDTTFHFQPVFKNMLFNPTSMHSWEPDFIWDGDPQNRKNNLNEDYRAAHWHVAPFVQVVCSPAVLMFKKGGPPEVANAVERGVRVKRLRKALVSLRWGTQRSIPPQPDDGYLELEEALDLARQKYDERDAVYAQMEQDAAEHQRLKDEESERCEREAEAKQKSQARSCAIM